MMGKCPGRPSGLLLGPPQRVSGSYKDGSTWWFFGRTREPVPLVSIACCEPVQHSDQVTCASCGQSWDAGEDFYECPYTTVRENALAAAMRAFVIVFLSSLCCGLCILAVAWAAR